MSIQTLHFAFSAVSLFMVCAMPSTAQNQPILLNVDAREAPHKVLHAKLTMPVKSGAFTLTYPKWIPGEHGPTGPIVNLTGLKLMANGKPIAWMRDQDDMYAIHCEIPAGVKELEATYDFLLATTTDSLAAASSGTSQLNILSWNHVAFYPKGAKSDDLTYSASLRLPAGWKYGTSLPVASESADGIQFKPVSLTTLVDSPVISGSHYRAIQLSSEAGRNHEIDMIADHEEELAMSDDTIAHCKQLVAETGALFGARHYGQYRFLLTLSDKISHYGLEHHESSEDRVNGQTLLNELSRKRVGGLLAHEFTHSWNGKYRRPAGLATPDYSLPMRGELLWVYEGLTDYLGEVLSTRSGFQTVAEYRDYLASTAAEMEHVSGRGWRPLADTAIAAQLLYTAPREWSSARRGTDFYPEGDLIWLEADVIIRQKTGGKSSLNDFCRKFHGGESSAPMVKPYKFEDVVAMLNTIAPYDWKGFFQTRVYDVNLHAPLGGIIGSGWKLVFDETPNESQKTSEQQYKFASFVYTLGFSTGEDGSVGDISPDSAAAKAGITPGMKIIGVNGRKYSSDGLHEAIKAAKTTQKSIELLAEDGDLYPTFRLSYFGGEKYPHLVQDKSMPDLLSDILKSYAPPK